MGILQKLKRLFKEREKKEIINIELGNIRVKSLRRLAFLKFMLYREWIEKHRKEYKEFGEFIKNVEAITVYDILKRYDGKKSISIPKVYDYLNTLKALNDIEEMENKQVMLIE